MAESAEKVGKVTFDPRYGIGSTPNNEEIDYLGFVAYMKPSTFLKLAAKLTVEPTSMPFMVQSIQDGKPIGNPSLNIELDTNMQSIARIVGHEGRNRCMAILTIQGDTEIPVHCFLKYLRARNLTNKHLEFMSGQMLSENKRTVDGPLFQQAILRRARITI